MIIHVSEINEHGWFKEIRRENCCGDMDWNGGRVGFSDYHHTDSFGAIIIDHSGDAQLVFHMQFCPFCGEKIEIVQENPDKVARWTVWGEDDNRELKPFASFWIWNLAELWEQKFHWKNRKAKIETIILENPLTSSV